MRMLMSRISRCCSVILRSSFKGAVNTREAGVFEHSATMELTSISQWAAYRIVIQSLPVEHHMLVKQSAMGIPCCSLKNLLREPQRRPTTSCIANTAYHELPEMEFLRLHGDDQAYHEVL